MFFSLAPVSCFLFSQILSFESLFTCHLFVSKYFLELSSGNWWFYFIARWSNGMHFSCECFFLKTVFSSMFVIAITSCFTSAPGSIWYAVNINRQNFSIIRLCLFPTPCQRFKLIQTCLVITGQTNLIPASCYDSFRVKTIISL